MTMREKMARAMADLRINHQKWDDIHPLLRNGYLTAADAALSAMEEPTEAMVAAGGDELLAEWDDPIGATTAIFRAMIGAAKEG